MVYKEQIRYKCNCDLRQFLTIKSVVILYLLKKLVN